MKKRFYGSSIIILIYIVYLGFILNVFYPKTTSPYTADALDNPFKRCDSVQECVEKVEIRGIEKSDTKDVVVFCASHLNTELDNFGNKALNEFNSFNVSLANAAWAFIWGIVGAIAINFILKTWQDFCSLTEVNNQSKK